LTESNNITLLYPEQQKPRAGADEQAVYLPTKKKTKKRDQEKTKKKPPTTTAEVAALLLVLWVRRAVIARTQSTIPDPKPSTGKTES
jgi:hypothetical protein